MIGLELAGFGAFAPPVTALLDGSENDGTNLFGAGPIAFTSGWSALATVLTPNNAVAPDGTTTAARVLEDATTDRHGCFATPSITAGGTYTYSIYAKSITRRYLQLFIGANSGTGQVYAYFDLQSGAVTDSGIAANGGSTTIGTCTIAQAANGFWKCTMPGVLLNGATSAPYFQPMCSDVATFGAPLQFNNPSFAGNTSNGLYLWRPKVAL
jgi:hypothetical protein